MDFNKVNEANKAGENTPAASNINTDKQVIPPVEDGVDKQPANTCLLYTSPSPRD